MRTLESDVPGVEPGARPPDRLRLFALVALTVLLLVLCALLAFPLLPAITWAVALAILAWPIHRWIGHHIDRPVLAAASSSAAVVVLILVPSMFVTYQIAREAAVVADNMSGEEASADVRERASSVPWLDSALAFMDRMGVDLGEEAVRSIRAHTWDATKVAQDSLTAVIQFLVAMFILYHLFRDRGTFLHGLRDLLPLSRSESDYLFKRAADSVHANLYAAAVTSLIAAVGGGLVFWATGLPAPVLWASVMFVLGILPLVGSGLVWVPAAAYLAMNGQWIGCGCVLAWGVLTAIFVNNLLYARLAGERMRLHDVPALISFLGGVALFGVSGMILGPAILAVTAALLEVWKRRASDRV